MFMKTTIVKVLGCTLLSCTALFSGCANQSQALYEWGGYQAQVYEHFKTQGSAPQEQIQALEKDLQKIQSKGAAIPPGYYAHLGLLYMSVGNNDQGLQSLQKEKALFPESARYIDFLLAKANK
jgi:hypothetical protein